MSRDWPFQVDAFRAILFVQCPANVCVHVVIEWLQLLPQDLQVLLKGRGFIQGTPECSVVRVTCEHSQGRNHSSMRSTKVLNVGVHVERPLQRPYH